MSFLEDYEVEAIILNVVQERGEKGVSQEEIEKILDWASMIRFSQALLDLVIKHQVVIMHFDEEQEEPMIKLSSDEMMKRS